MSRGHGELQRKILDALQEKNWVIIRDLLPDGSGHVEYSSISRAAHLLKKRGDVDLHYRSVPVDDGTDRLFKRSKSVLVVSKPGVDVPYLFRGEWLSMEEKRKRLSVARDVLNIRLQQLKQQAGF